MNPKNQEYLDAKVSLKLINSITCSPLAWDHGEQHPEDDKKLPHLIFGS